MSETPPIPDPTPNAPENLPVTPPPLTGEVAVAVTPESPPAPPRPWGFWATLGFGLLIFFVNVMLQVVVAIVAASLGAYGKPASKITKAEFENNGFVLSMAMLISTPVFCGLTVLFAKLRRNMSLKTYLGLCWPDGKTFLRWTIGMVILLAVSDVTTTFLSKDVVTDFMIKAYQTAVFAPLLWLALIVAAPLGEELFFRGFMFEGLRQSRLGAHGAIILTSVFWASLHLQYDAYGIASILLTGLLLGYARLRTGSVWLCICLHAMMNLGASIELLVYLHMKG